MQSYYLKVKTEVANFNIDLTLILETLAYVPNGWGLA